MALMPAYRLIEWGRPPEFVDVPVPTPGAGEVLLKMAGAGLCRSDLEVMDQAAGAEPFAAVLPAGFTLGHENAGTVFGWGTGVEDLREGDVAMVHHVRSCGHCEYCLDGTEQSCMSFARGAVTLTRGIGLDGGLAPYLVVPRHELIVVPGADPVALAPLTDAGVTAYRAVVRALDRLRPGATALVIGLGGLGFYAVQFVKLLSAARVIGIDPAEGRRALAMQAGADEVRAPGQDARDAVMAFTAGHGADVILDFVGTDATLALAASVSRPSSHVVLIGLGAGTLPLGWGRIATGATFAISMGSSRSDLRAVAMLAAEKRLLIEREDFAFADVAEAYRRLRAGALKGRAVITFDP